MQTPRDPGVLTTPPRRIRRRSHPTLMPIKIVAEELQQRFQFLRRGTMKALRLEAFIIDRGAKALRHFAYNTPKNAPGVSHISQNRS